VRGATATREELVALFLEVDADGDGVMTAAERQAAVTPPSTAYDHTTVILSVEVCHL
jgi:hypothetical protein